MPELRQWQRFCHGADKMQEFPSPCCEAALQKEWQGFGALFADKSGQSQTKHKKLSRRSVKGLRAFWTKWTKFLNIFICVCAYTRIYNVYIYIFLVRKNKNILSILSNPLAERLDGKNFLSGFCPVFCPHHLLRRGSAACAWRCPKTSEAVKPLWAPALLPPVPSVAPNCSQNQERLVPGERDFTHSTGRPRRVPRRPPLIGIRHSRENSCQLVRGKPLKVTKKVTICAFYCDFSPENSKKRRKSAGFFVRKNI